MFKKLFHIHKWEDPEIPPVEDQVSKDYWLFVITGKVCKECGAKKIYEGPMFGWRLLK